MRNGRLVSKPFQELSISQVILHPQYDETRLFNDLSVIVTNGTIFLGHSVTPVCVPRQDHVKSNETQCVLPLLNTYGTVMKSMGMIKS